MSPLRIAAAESGSMLQELVSWAQGIATLVVLLLGGAVSYSRVVKRSDRERRADERSGEWQARVEDLDEELLEVHERYIWIRDYLIEHLEHEHGVRDGLSVIQHLYEINQDQAPE